MNKITRIGLLVMVALLLAIPAMAQDMTFGLSQEDFAALAGANANSVQQTQYDFTYNVTVTLEGAGVPIDVVLDGTGSLNIDAEQIGLSVAGNADVMGQSTPLEGELRVIGETIYARGTNPTTGEDTGWFSLDGAVLDSVDMDQFEPDTLLGEDTLSDEAMFGLLGAAGQIDPQSFLFLSRDGDTFTADLSLFELFSSPGLADALNNILAESDAPMTLSAEAFADTSITLDQTIDPVAGLVTGSTLSIISTVNPVDLGASGSPATVIVILDVAVSNYGSATVVAAPESAVEVPSTLVTGVLEDAGLAGGEAVGDAAPAVSSDPVAIELTCDSRGFDFEGGPGSVFTGTCPSDCTGGVLWGTDFYTDDSSICTAAIHAGAIPAAGGEVVMTIADGMDSYPASEQNGVASSEWGSWGRSFMFGAAGDGVSADMDTVSAASATVATDLPNSYTFPNGVTFGYPEGYEIQTESDVVTTLMAGTGRAFIQAYETEVLFGDMDMGLGFMMDTYATTAATTWGFEYSLDDYVETEVNGRTLQVLEFTGTQSGEPVVGSVIIVPYTNGGYGYTITYALEPVPATILEDALAVASSLDN
ncbi:MAG: LCCL domain-containing protein [Chloroflexota bacterium]